MREYEPKTHLNVGGPRGWTTFCGRESHSFVDEHRTDEWDEVNCKRCRSEVERREAWNARREQLETSIRSQLWGRARSQGWLNSKGGLSKRGQTAALEFIIGLAAGFVAAELPESQWALNQAFLCSIRGVAERFPPPEPAKGAADA